MKVITKILLILMVCTFFPVLAVRNILITFTPEASEYIAKYGTISELDRLNKKFGATVLHKFEREDTAIMLWKLKLLSSIDLKTLQLEYGTLYMMRNAKQYKIIAELNDIDKYQAS